MTDREKVEQGLNICTSAEPCNGCPYLGERNCSLEMVKDTLALLKEQEEEIEKLKEIIIKADSSLEIVKERLNELLYEDFRRGLDETIR